MLRTQKGEDRLSVGRGAWKDVVKEMIRLMWGRVENGMELDTRRGYCEVIKILHGFSTLWFLPGFYFHLQTFAMGIL